MYQYAIGMVGIVSVVRHLNSGGKLVYQKKKDKKGAKNSSWIISSTEEGKEEKRR